MNGSDIPDTPSVKRYSSFRSLPYKSEDGGKAQGKNLAHGWVPQLWRVCERQLWRRRGGGGKGRYQKTGVPLARVVNVLWLLTSRAEDSSGEIEAILATAAEVNVGREPAKGQNLSRSGDLRNGEGC